MQVGLIEDDFGMELLVAGKIIDLNLPISMVYTHVWQNREKPQNASSRGDAGSRRSRTLSSSGSRRSESLNAQRGASERIFILKLHQYVAFLILPMLQIDLWSYCLFTLGNRNALEK